MKKKTLGFLSISLLMTLISCGKKVEEIRGGQIQLGQEVTSPILDITFNNSFPSLSTAIARNGNFTIPGAFAFSSSARITKPFEIFYNLVEQPFHFEFKCVYSPDNVSKFFYLEHCLNDAGQNMGSVSGVDFILDAGKKILMQSSERNLFQTIIRFQIDWK